MADETRNAFGLLEDEEAHEIVDAYDGDENEPEQREGNDPASGRPSPGETDTKDGESTADTNPPAETGTEPPAQPSPGLEPGEQAPETAAEPPEPPQLLAGKYADVDALVRGYDELQGLQNRTATRLRETEDLVARQNAWVQEILPALTQRQPSQAQPQAPAPVALSPELQRRMSEAGFEPEQAEIVQTLARDIAEQIAAARVGEVEQQLLGRQLQAQQQQQGEMEIAERQRSVDAFFAKHPEVIRGSGEDISVGNIAVELDLDIAAEDALDIAYEAYRDPQLLFVLRAQPDLIDTDEGMEIARQMAATRRAVAGGQPAPQPANGQTPEQRAAAHRAAHVETRSTATRPGTSGDAVLDDWQKALKLAEAERSAFGV